MCRPTETVQAAAGAPASKAGAQHPRQSYLDGFLRDAAKAAAAFATTQTPRQQGPLQRHIKASAANQGFFGHYQAAHEQAARMRLSGGEGKVSTLPRRRAGDGEGPGEWWLGESAGRADVPLWWRGAGDHPAKAGQYMWQWWPAGSAGEPFRHGRGS